MRNLCVSFFSEIIRTDDYNTKLLDGIQADDFYILKDSDFADVKCKSKNGDVLVNLFMLIFLKMFLLL